MKIYHATLGATAITFLVAVAAIPVSFQLAGSAHDPDAIEVIGFMFAIALFILTAILAIATAAIWSYEREKEL